MSYYTLFGPHLDPEEQQDFAQREIELKPSEPSRAANAASSIFRGLSHVVGAVVRAPGELGAHILGLNDCDLLGLEEGPHNYEKHHFFPEVHDETSMNDLPNVLQEKLRLVDDEKEIKKEETQLKSLLAEQVRMGLVLEKIKDEEIAATNKAINDAEYAELMAGLAKDEPKVAATEEKVIEKPVEVQSELRDLEVELMRMAFPTLGQRIGQGESFIQKTWGFISWLIAPIQGRERNHNGGIIQLLDNGLATGLVQTTIEAQKEAALDKYMKNGEDFVYGLVNVRPLVKSDPFVVKVARSIVLGIVDIFQGIGRLFSSNKEETIEAVSGCLTKEEFNRANEQTKIERTNAAIRNRVFVVIEGIVRSIPVVKTIADYCPAVIHHIGMTIVSAIIDDPLKFARDYIFGENNQERMKAVLDQVQTDVVINLTENLKIVNKTYNNRSTYDYGVNNDYEAAIQNEILKDLPEHRAIPVLDEDEEFVYLRRDDLIQAGTVGIREAIAEKKIKTDKAVKELNDKYALEEKRLKEKLDRSMGTLIRRNQMEFEKIAKGDKTLNLGKFGEFNKSYNAKVDALKKAHRTELNKFRDACNSEIKKLRNQEIEEVEKLETSITLDSAILERENNLKTARNNSPKYLEDLAKLESEAASVQGKNPTVYAEKVQAIANLKTEEDKRIINRKKSLEEAVKHLKTLKAVQEKLSQAEDVYVKSLVTLIIDKVIYPNGIPNGLQNLIKLMGKDPREFISGLVMNQLKPELARLDQPELLYPIMNDQVAWNLPASTPQRKVLNGADKEENREGLIANINTLIDLNLGQLFGGGLVDKLIDPKGAAGLLLNRLDATRVNKYLIFSAVDAALNAVVTVAGKTTEIQKDGMILING